MIFIGVLVLLFGASTAIDLTGCNGQPKVIDGLLRLQGEVTSPGFKEGQEYPNDLFCHYRIRAPFGFGIKLTFAEIDVEVADMCMADAVEIAELGQQPRGLGVFCGNDTYPPIVAQANMVDIIFRTNFMVGQRGFRIKYEVSGRPSVCNYLGTIPCRNRRCYNPMDRCNGVDNCGDGSDEEGCPFPPKTTECGLRNKTSFYGYDRVIGGQEAEPGSWPWQADLQANFIHPNGHMCGGTLINSQWVLTAAHCFEQFRVPELWRVHLGNHHKFKRDQSEQVRMVQRIILYPGTTGQDLIRLPYVDVTNDIALMKLNAPVKFTNQVRPACLPAQGYNIPIGTKCMASGWGMTRGTGSNDVLKEIDLTIQPESVCNSTMTGPMDPARMICVKNTRGFQDVCHGDSGGPLVCEINNKWHVLGATSFGTQGNFEGGLCALPGSATVYARAAHKADWIHQQINRYS